MKISKVQAEALATFVCKVRTDWRHAGVMAAIQKCESEWPLDIARALINLAADASVQTPGLLHGPGPHWLRPDGSKVARRGDHDIPCPDHPGLVQPCGLCREGKIPPPPDVLATIRQTLAEAPDLSDKAARERLAQKETQ